jgi:hypothetical protein
MNNNTKIADQLGREQIPDLAEVMNIRNVLMDEAENIDGFEHEGSGAGCGSADFRFYVYDKQNKTRKYYKVEVEEIEE